jgi:acyl-CoA synthetase (AMP-forming)/AMP-acid ligase II
LDFRRSLPGEKKKKEKRKEKHAEGKMSGAGQRCSTFSEVRTSDTSAEDEQKRFDEFVATLGIARGCNTIVEQRPRTIADALRYRAESAATASELAYVWMEDGEREGDKLTFSELWGKARTIGAELRRRRLQGEPVVLLFSLEGLEFVVAFWACIVAGAVAVPTYPPDPERMNRSLPRFEAIVQDCGSHFVLTTRDIKDMMALVEEALPESFKSLEFVPVEDLLESPPPPEDEEWADAGISQRSVAFLQYTSGSTGSPKGVIVTHKSLLYNELINLKVSRKPDGSRFCAWLPLFHDMGLIGCVCFAVFTGSVLYLMSPTAFIKKPFRWLKLISDKRIDLTAAPNFAYELCVRKVTSEMMAQLDLSCLRIVGIAAEPIRPSTLRSFLGKFSECGFPATAIAPCYGLAEATLTVSMSAP